MCTDARTLPVTPRRGMRPAGLLLAWLLLACQGASANLATPFVGQIDVNTAFVTGASLATDIAFHADGRAIVTRKTGQIHVRRTDGSVNVLAYPFPGTLDTESEKGLLGVVADPAVATNDRFYFFVSNGPDDEDKQRVYRATLTPANTLVVDTNPVVGLARGVGPGLKGPSNHNGGGLVIHAGKLYVSVGDTGANASPPVNKFGSCLNHGNGKILRVNLDGSVPADNPLTGLTSVSGCTSPTGAWLDGLAPDQRIFAWGFRNPWRLWVDPQTGLLWVGDVGESTQEEVSIGGGDANYGYPFVEGTFAWGNVGGRNCNFGLVPARPCTGPAYTYPRSQGRSITGGLVLDSADWQRVLGGPRYVFGDFALSWLRLLPVNPARTGFASSQTTDLATYTGGPVSFRTGPDDALYVVYLQSGSVYRFAPVPCTDCATQVPLLPWAALALGAALCGAIARRRLARAH